MVKATQGLVRIVNARLCFGFNRSIESGRLTHLYPTEAISYIAVSYFTFLYPYRIEGYGILD